MWVSALLGMGIKYAEILLAVYFQKAIPQSYRRRPHVLYGARTWLQASGSVVFGGGHWGGLNGGCFTQVNAVCSVLGEGNLWLTAIVGAGIALLAGLCIFGGIHRISKVTSVLVPVFSILFLGAGLVVIFCCLPQLPGVFALIFQQAFSLESVSGGLMGTGLALSLRLGMARGIFSNEAGVGSSPMVYASGKESDPVRQGLWGVLEVFLDTIVICTVNRFGYFAHGRDFSCPNPHGAGESGFFFGAGGMGAAGTWGLYLFICLCRIAELVFLRGTRDPLSGKK